ncbi:MAG: glycosyltransferase family 2 protein [Candidatus Omnitrophica bacterium]|nr:glycosyltransferase family 2 protein [Candidatus Omnitrophota bacterium]
MTILFIVLLVLIFHTYIGYPVALRLLNMFVKPYKVNKAGVYPFVSIVIPAYNEQAAIAEKLENVLSLDYPKDKIEIVVASDCSSDNTDAIVRSFSLRGVRLCRLRNRGGKIAAYRNVIPSLKGDIIIFSDATGILEKDGILKLVRNFNDKKVGCVGGRLKYVDPGELSIGEGEKTYWEYEDGVKNFESRLSSLTSVSGTFYAVRKGLYPIYIKDYLADDLLVPLTVKKRGFLTVFEPEAVCREVTVPTGKDEIKKRVRITVQNIGGLLDQACMLNFIKYGLYSVMLISHKLFRLLSPFLLIMLFLVCLMMSFGSLFYLMLLICQVLFYVLGITGHFYHNNRPKLLNAVYYFCLSNYAIFVGFLEYASGNRMATWETAR